MRVVYPDYYPEFRCIADLCRHSCCIGWEIDIDDETVSRYRTLPGTVGERLRRFVDDSEETPHFRLMPDGRCPFLNGRGLCDLILELGENSLCQICRDHPRYRGFFSRRTELGVGLCCEAAARLILERKAPVQLLSDEGQETLTESESAFIALRESLFVSAQNRSIPIGEREENILRMTGGILPNLTAPQWAALLRPLERLDPLWDEALDSLQAWGVDKLQIPESWDTMREQLLVYFLYRHLTGALEDGDISDRAAFAVMSERIISTLWVTVRAETSEDMADVARAYSAEIEYSDENTDKLLDWLYEQ